VKCEIKGEKTIKTKNLEVEFKNRSFDIHESDKESVVILVGGKAFFKIRNKVYKARRSDVFLSKPYALYLPAGKSAKIERISEDLMVVVAKTDSNRGEKTMFIRQRDIKTEYTEKGDFRAKIRNILPEKTAERIACGEMINFPGRWSNFPPYKATPADKMEMEMEMEMEKVCFFKIKPEGGFGILRVYGNGFNELYTVENNSLVTIERGCHSLVSIPGYTIYHLWILASGDGGECEAGEIEQVEHQRKLQ
jgi:5-deoxy-glucuronate isomerase